MLETPEAPETPDTPDISERLHLLQHLLRRPPATRTIWAEVVATQSERGGFSAIFGFGGLDRLEFRNTDLLQINANRSDVLTSTFKCLDKLLESDALEEWSRSRSPRVSVRFENESGYGEGVLRDWIAIVLDELYSSGVFKQVAPRVVHPEVDSSKTSIATPHKWGWLAGFVTGLAARAGIHTGYHLSKAFASLVLNRRPDLEDATKEIDEGIEGMCRQILSHPQDEAIGCLTFEYKESGLLPNGCGEDVRVTRANRKLFTKLMCARVCGIDHGEVASIARGFRRGLVLALGLETFETFETRLWDVTVEDFNETLGGNLEVRAEDVLSNVKFCQGHNVTKDRAEELVAHFKRHVEGMTSERRRRLLRFWTGSSAPAAKMQFVVVEDHGEGRRPYSHTCYQQLTVPLADTPEETLDRLDESIANCEAIVD